MEYISADIGSYIGGKVHHWDWVDPDLMSLLELDGFLTDVGYQEQVKTKNIEEFRVKNNYSYYYRKEGMNMKEGLVELKSDQDLLSMYIDRLTIYVQKLYLIKKKDLEDNLSTTNLRASPNAMPQTNEVGEDIDTDCGDSDDLGSCHSSDDESRTRKKLEEFNPARDMENPQFCVGKIFRDLNTFKEAIIAYSIKNKFPLRFAHSDPTRVQVCCDKNCAWNIWASPSQDGNKVHIKACTLQHDRCVLLTRHKWFTYKFIVRKYLLRFEIDPKWGNDSIAQTVEEDFHYSTSKWTARKAREYAVNLIRRLLVRRALQPVAGRSSSLTVAS
ncbi:unnamed protein product [Linum tenue]|uniref:Transposase MuDR plant domain-containing protein n=1 Tax=Linum tenue TaxID=586396 RepID=A0AAV0NLU9_9ROSI|nr:unnamed protein product [Linum tenue]